MSSFADPVPVIPPQATPVLIHGGGHKRRLIWDLVSIDRVRSAAGSRVGGAAERGGSVWCRPCRRSVGRSVRAR